MKEKVNVSLYGENYLEKFRELKLADKDLLLKSKSEIVKIAFEKYYSDKLTNQKLKKEETTSVDNAPVVQPFNSIHEIISNQVSLSENLIVPQFNDQRQTFIV